jgi:hypothetical protein
LEKFPLRLLQLQHKGHNLLIWFQHVSAAQFSGEKTDLPAVSYGSTPTLFIFTFRS